MMRTGTLFPSEVSGMDRFAFDCSVKKRLERNAIGFRDTRNKCRSPRWLFRSDGNLGGSLGDHFEALDKERAFCVRTCSET